MATRTPTASRNQLLALLSQSDRDLLLPHLRLVTLETRHQIEDRNRPIKHVYFVEEGIASVVAAGAGDKEIEVGLIGREGMTGIVVVMGNHRSPNKTYTQVRGQALRIAVAEFRDALEASATLKAMLLKFAQTFMVQTAHTAIANGRATVEARLARWLLMARDRLDDDKLPLTHEFLALMLGVRRAGVTVALDHLENRGLLNANRGHVLMIDRKGLERIAKGYYGVPEAEYRRLMG